MTTHQGSKWLDSLLNEEDDHWKSSLSIVMVDANESDFENDKLQESTQSKQQTIKGVVDNHFSSSSLSIVMVDADSDDDELRQVAKKQKPRKEEEDNTHISSYELKNKENNGQNQDNTLLNRHVSQQGFRATRAFERIQKNQWLYLAWGLFRLTPPLLSMVALSLSIYALVDFAQFSKEYSDLQHQAKKQTQNDFDLVQGAFVSTMNLVLIGDAGLDACEISTDSDDHIDLSSISMKVLRDLTKLTESARYVSVSLLPSGTVWSDYFLERFPSADGELFDYSNFANPTRIAIICLSGIPNMEPLFGTFLASLVFDAASVVLLIVPAIILWTGQRKDTRKSNLILFGIDVAFFFVSLALLLVTAQLSSSEKGYGVDTVSGRVFFVGDNSWNERHKEGINPDYWGQIPNKYCSSEHVISCFPNNSYQQGCTAATIDVTVPKELLAQDGDRWYINLKATGTSLLQKNITKFLSLATDDQAYLAHLRDSFEEAAFATIPNTADAEILEFRDMLFRSACPLSGQQEFFWSDSDLQKIRFPKESPDYEFVCNAQCEHNWTDLSTEILLDCPPGCRSVSCGCTPMKYSSCPINCPDVQSADSCGCLAFGYGMWKYNCTSQFTVVTEEIYRQFTSFAVDNVREGLAYDIAATTIDFVAICLIAISLFVPPIRKLLHKNKEVSRRSIKPQISFASFGQTLSLWKSSRQRSHFTSTNNGAHENNGV